MVVVELFLFSLVECIFRVLRTLDVFVHDTFFCFYGLEGNQPDKLETRLWVKEELSQELQLVREHYLP